MTATELYEIVTGHQEVWGKHFVIVKRSDGYIGFYHPFSNDELDPEHVENELLGLGVKWLAFANAGDWYVSSLQQNWHGETDIEVTFLCGGRPRSCAVRRTSVLAAVYAAIAEVKKEVPNG